MDALRSLLVHLDAGRHAPARLELARALAARHEARLRALFAVQPVPDEIEVEHHRRARARFTRSTGAAGWPVEWLDVPLEQPDEAFSSVALHADLLVLGQRDPMDAEAFDLPVDFVESVLAATGKPALVVPHTAHAPADVIDCVLLAWHPRREAAQALTSALPLLQSAREVHLVTWNDDDALLSALQQEVVDHLRLHDVDAVQCHRGGVPPDVGKALLSTAAGVGADLLVMGCYGHSRARELVLGGATRTVLRDMHLPVLMAH